MGDILRNINSGNKCGIDRSSEALACARFLDKKTKYMIGDLDSAAELLPKKLDVLITVNFIHGISPDELKQCYEKIVRETKIKEIIVDSHQGEGYRYHHNFESMIIGYYVDEYIYNYEGRKVFILRPTNL